MKNKKKESRKESKKGETKSELVSLEISLSVKSAKEKTETIDEEVEVVEPEEDDNEKSNAAVYLGIRPNIYGSGPAKSNVDYDEIYSHLGQTRAKGMYDDVSGGGGDSIDRVPERSLVDSEVIHDAIQWEKYFLSGDRMGDFGAVPMAGINSKDWERFRLWAKVEYVMYNLMRQTS
jgi:hypothetical protein